MWSMQLRLNDCYRQQRFPYPGFASDATIALGADDGEPSEAFVAAALERHVLQKLFQRIHQGAHGRRLRSADFQQAARARR